MTIGIFVVCYRTATLYTCVPAAHHIHAGIGGKGNLCVGRQQCAIGIIGRRRRQRAFGYGKHFAQRIAIDKPFAGRQACKGETTR